jgi:hypothetical protein
MDEAFGTRLAALPKDAAVWIVASGENSPAATRLWEATGQTVTTFRKQSFADVLPTVDMHHPGWRELEVYGESPNVAVMDALGEFGAGDTLHISGGFIFVRRNP